MLLGALLLVSLAAVPVLGGDLRRLANIRFRYPGVAFVALAVQVVVIEVVPGAGQPVIASVHVLTYLLLMTFVALNVALPGAVVIAVGGLANAVAITANGGVMPARPGALATAGLQAPAGEFVNSGAVTQPVFPWLGDYFAVPSSLPLANVFSVGDVLLLIGCTVLVHRVCGSALAAGGSSRSPRCAAA
ncbi:MAG TPA: DUF5317 family protein [Solirubrobacteraceae bacterium]|jgi:hypothetical protein